MVHSRLLEAADRGAGVLLLSEDLDEILALNDRILVMYEGGLSEVDDRESIVEIGLRMAGGVARGAFSHPRRQGGRPMKIVVALGGNALLQRGEPPTAEVQRRPRRRGDGRGRRARPRPRRRAHAWQRAPGGAARAAGGSAYTEVPAYPLDVLGAESEGMIGYVLEQELENRLPGHERRDRAHAGRRRPRRPGVRRAVEADRRDLHARSRPGSWPRERGWSIAPDNAHFRRVVASPQPLRIVELRRDPDARRLGRARRLLRRRRHSGDGSTSRARCAASRR